jgi:uncharacterized protein (DUF1330 family)
LTYPVGLKKTTGSHLYNHSKGGKMMAGFWIVLGSTVKDQEAFDEYVRLWNPIAERYGAAFVVAGGRHETREGEDCARVVVIEFPSYEKAVACYDDPDYQESLIYARKAYDRHLVIVEGT